MPAPEVTGDVARGEQWPSLPLGEWRDTYATLHLWSQIVGKTRLALVPMLNHWWQATLYVTSRGLTTALMPCGASAFQVDFDFIDHSLLISTTSGATRKLPLVPRPVAEFYGEYMNALDSLGLDVNIWPVPVELEHVIPFGDDSEHASYDPDFANRFWRILVQSHAVMQRFRGRFLGKSSPVHFFWGSFDLAVTRFSGRLAPTHPGGVPNLPDWVVREAYSHEVISAGFWPGGGAIDEAAFYCYAYPEPPGFADAIVRPKEARYSQDLKEFILPYDAVRTASSPDDALLSFLQSCYDAAADLGHWDRAALERTAEVSGR
ncbi:MAG TPA: DUF5996 family protein [Gemmatimonadaceae bacterium]|jgi:hypothetical protein